MPQITQVRPNLVGTPGLQLALDQRYVTKSLQHLIVRDGVAALNRPVETERVTRRSFRLRPRLTSIVPLSSSGMPQTNAR